MWQTKTFKTKQAMEKFISTNEGKIQTDEKDNSSTGS